MKTGKSPENFIICTIDPALQPPYVGIAVKIFFSENGPKQKFRAGFGTLKIFFFKIAQLEAESLPDSVYNRIKPYNMYFEC